jgi:hypothetical protein
MKTDLKMLFEELEFLKIFISHFLEKLAFKQAGVKPDSPHIDKG